MTVARINVSTEYRRPQGVEGAVYRLGMALVAWAHTRARRPGELRAAVRRRSELLVRVDAERDAALARAAQTRAI